MESSLHRPTCAIILPTNFKALTLQVLNTQLSKLFSMFEFVTILLHEEDKIESYTGLNWTHPIIDIQNNRFHAHCLDEGKLHLVRIWSMDGKFKAASTAIKELCPVAMKRFNIMMPG